MIDVSAPRSPGWWLDRLLSKLNDRRPRYDLLDSYYRGEACVPANATKATRSAYRRLMQFARTNYAELVVEAVRERMYPLGFRTGADGDELGDAEAWRIWQANALDADASLVHRASLTMGDAYVIVGPVDAETGAPLITPEDPREVIVEYDAAKRRKPLAALKAYTDEVDGVARAYLYLPGVVYRAVRKEPMAGIVTGGIAGMASAGWEWDGAPDEFDPPVIPVVGFPNRASLTEAPMGEFEAHLGLLDRINYNTLNRLEIATMQAFRQRAVRGDLPTHDAEGNQIDYDDIFRADPGSLWQLPSTVDLWESGQVDLGPMHTAARDDVQDLAAVTRTPLFYLTPDAANGSAEGASLAREGLVFKTEDRIGQVTESWEQVMSLAFLFAGDEVRAQRGDMEVIWRSPERFSLAERYDAASKAIAAGVPWRTVMADVLQMSPQAIARMEAERAGDLLLAPPTSAAL